MKTPSQFPLQLLYSYNLCHWFTDVHTRLFTAKQQFLDDPGFALTLSHIAFDNLPVVENLPRCRIHNTTNGHRRLNSPYNRGNPIGAFQKGARVHHPLVELFSRLIRSSKEYQSCNLCTARLTRSAVASYWRRNGFSEAPAPERDDLIIKTHLLVIKMDFGVLFQWIRLKLRDLWCGVLWLLFMTFHWNPAKSVRIKTVQWEKNKLNVSNICEWIKEKN